MRVFNADDLKMSELVRLARIGFATEARENEVKARIMNDKARAEILSVDRSKVTLTDGSPVTEDHRELKSNGQQKGYVVLSEEERTKGFVRPVRCSYVHVACGGVTTMGRALAETYARDPKFYGATFCAQCGTHFPVGEQGEFAWVGTDEKVGT